MKSLISSLRTRKSTGFVSTLHGLFLALIVLGFGPILEARVTLGTNPISSTSEAYRAVWQIQNIEPGSRFNPNKGDIRGTAFAVASNLFLTNFHVFNGLHYSGRPLTRIFLVQEGNPTAIKVKGVHIVSGIYDLVLFQTTTKVDDYLSLANKDFTLKRKERLTIIGYPGGSLAIGRPMEQRGGTINYENSLVYGFGTTISDLDGASGGPMLNSQGEVVGVFSIGNANLAYGTKVEHLWNFLKNRKPGETSTRTKRTFCARPDNLTQCIEAEKNNVRTMAENLDTLALFQMGLSYSYINETNEDWDQSDDKLKMAAEHGFPLAHHELGLSHYRAKTPARDKLAIVQFEKSAKSGLAESQYMLAKMYFYGQGTYRDGKQALYWIDQSIQRGSGGAVKLKPKICNRYRSAAFASQSCSENLNKDSKSSEVMWTVKRSNVRIGPGTSYSKIGLLEPGEAVGVIEQTGNWFKLQPLPGQPRRFVYAPLLTRIRPTNAAE